MGSAVGHELDWLRSRQRCIAQWVAPWNATQFCVCHRWSNMTVSCGAQDSLPRAHAQQSWVTISSAKHIHRPLQAKHTTPQPTALAAASFHPSGHTPFLQSQIDAATCATSASMACGVLKSRRCVLKAELVPQAALKTAAYRAAAATAPHGQQSSKAACSGHSRVVYMLLMLLSPAQTAWALRLLH